MHRLVRFYPFGFLPHLDDVSDSTVSSFERETTRSNELLSSHTDTTVSRPYEQVMKTKNKNPTRNVGALVATAKCTQQVSFTDLRGGQTAGLIVWRDVDEAKPTACHVDGGSVEV